MWVCRKLLETGVVQPWSDNHTLLGERVCGPVKGRCVSVTKETASSFAISDLHYKKTAISFLLVGIKL